MEKLCLPEGSN